MESINRTMQRLYQTPGFRQRYEDLKHEVLDHPEIQDFLEKNKNLVNDSMIEANLMKLYEYMSQTTNCQDCPGLHTCPNIMKGYEPLLVIENNRIDIHYRPCAEKVLDDERRKAKKLIKSYYMPKDILTASFADFMLDSEGRLDAFEHAERFTAEYGQKSNMKGLYLHGEFGVGKSYLLGAIANQLAEKGIPSLIVYVPEFLREMKQSLGDQSLNDKLEAVKTAPVLMLDDIGAEAMSSWTRDEVLGAVMQFRMNEQLPTFFTSNFDFSGLEHHLTYTQRGEEEKMKARRLMERIRFLSTPIKLGGPNRRHS